MHLFVQKQIKKTSLIVKKSFNIFLCYYLYWLHDLLSIKMKGKNKHIVPKERLDITYGSLNLPIAYDSKCCLILSLQCAVERKINFKDGTLI